MPDDREAEKADKRRSALTAFLREEARAQGFDLCRITRPDAIPEAAVRLGQFLDKGHHGTMGWMEETRDRRGDPRVLWSETRSIAVFGLNYGPDEDPRGILEKKDKAAISVYARNRDYHDVIKGRLKEIATRFAARSKEDVKVFVDTAPVMEKPLAGAAGLGWQGKHTNLVSRAFGSWLFLGSMFTTADLEPDEPEVDHCGSCRACLDACPTSAFPAPYQLDARRCISYLTIEHAGEIPLALRPRMGNRIYGCDDCQLVCPWNKFAQPSPLPDFDARAGLTGQQLVHLFGWDEATFLRQTEGGPIRRIGHERWLRNVAVALGNALRATGDPAVRAALQARAQDASALVRGHVAWALAQEAA